ncbi:MAG TPA: hypothetical protein VH062_07195 [Polyangiaceae bacterium]|jgi:hypothetical protein|nr:hypothetical protein [Polyangiaceae bacterium]
MTGGRRFSLFVATGTFVTLASCARPAPPAFVKVAKLGVFYGGQVEERTDIPFELDPGKQTQGFRVEFSEPLASDTDVEWRIDVPKADPEKKKKRAPGEPAEPPRTTLSGKDVARAGETTLDHVLTFHPGDPLGVWNVRVVVHDKVVIDRPVEVFDAAARKRLVPRDGGVF